MGGGVDGAIGGGGMEGHIQERGSEGMKKGDWDEVVRWEEIVKGMYVVETERTEDREYRER